MAASDSSTSRQKSAAFSPVTVRLQKAFETVEDTLDRFYTQRDFQVQIQRVKKASSSARRACLNELYRMMEKAGIPFERGQTLGDYETILARYDFPDLQQQDELFLETICNLIRQYPSPAELMENLVDHLEDPRDGWSEQPLRVRILRQFVKYGDFLSKAGYSSRKTICQKIEQKAGCLPGRRTLSDWIDDSFFDVLDTCGRPAKKRNGACGLIKLADDLSRGVLHSQRGSIQSLYLFGICYGMEFRKADPALRYWNCFEDRMFRDFYSNNLMRFFSAETEETDPVDPSGRGINWKNPYELIYLYWMDRALPVDQKIEQAEKMIRALKKRSAASTAPCIDFDSFTCRAESWIRESAISGGVDLFAQPEDDFLGFLARSYPIEPPPHRGMMHLSSQENSAWMVYSSLRNEFLLLLDENDDCLLNHQYGLCLPNSFAKLPSQEDQEEESSSRIRRVLRRADGYLRNSEAESSLFQKESFYSGQTMMENYLLNELRKENGLQARTRFPAFFRADGSLKSRSIELNLPLLNDLVAQDRKLPYIYRASSPDNVTRTRLLGLLYYVFNLQDDLNSLLDWKSLRSVHSEFKAFCDPYLIEAHYQPVSTRYLFDMLLVYSSFCRINL